MFITGATPSLTPFITEVDLVGQLAGHLLASGALQVQLQVVPSPLGPVDVVVVLPMFLNGSTGERISMLSSSLVVEGVLYCAEVAKSKLIHITVQQAVHRHQDM